MKTLKIVVEYTIENPKVDITESLPFIKSQFENTIQHEIGQICWTLGDYHDCEVTGAVITETYDLK